MERHILPAEWLWLIPALPLLGAFVNGVFGGKIRRRFGEKAVHAVAVLMPALSFAVALFYSLRMMRLPEESRHFLCTLYEWISIGTFSVPLAFWLDPLSCVMALMVTFVGTGIHVYSIGYMHGDRSYPRFFAFLNLFMFAMLTLVLADNFLVMFIGWEGVGLCSYLLIAFWYEDLKNARAGMKAFIANRVGDFGFLVGILALMWSMGGSWSGESYFLLRPEGLSLLFRDVEALAPTIAGQTIFGIAAPTFVCLCFFWGATAKSAQIPLYVWLPDAMAGPTPVSALIHAATMVTAGVYMVARLHFLFALSPAAMTVVACVGALTALFAATIGLFQYDIKKVLAYSTVSQLGYMFLAAGVGAYGVAVFHLLTHAFFKACLFLGAGSVIHAMHHAYHEAHNHHDDPQDMRNMGGLGRRMSTTRWTYLAACCAIAGFPLMSGFFSKDEILWKAFSNANTLVPGWLLWGMGFAAAFLTAFYMFRSYFMTFGGEFRGGDEAAHHLRESPRTITWVLAMLGFLSIAGGAMGLPHLWHLPNFLEGFLEVVLAPSEEHLRWIDYSHAAEWTLMAASVAVALSGFFLAFRLYGNGRSETASRILALFPRTHRLVFNKYYIDELYRATAIRAALAFSTACAWWDRRVVDGLVNLCGSVSRGVSWVHGIHDTYVIDGTVNGVARVLSASGRSLRKVQTGHIRTYLYAMLAGGLLLIVFRFAISR